MNLFKSLFGSHLYGTSTPSSDIDIKYIVLPDIGKLLCGDQIKNYTANTSNDRVKNTSDDVDVEYIPIQIFAKDFLGGQTYALEMAFSVLSDVYNSQQTLYDLRFKMFVGQLVNDYLTSNVKAMTGYALNQAHVYGIKGSRLETVEKFHNELMRRLLTQEVSPEEKFLEHHWMQWVDLHKNKYLFMSSYQNHDESLPALSLIEKLYPFNISYNDALYRTDSLLSKYGQRAQSAKKDGVDWKALSHAVRITLEACDVLEHHTLTFPFDDVTAKHLLDIKLGNVPYAQVEQELVEHLDRLERLKGDTTLPELTPKMQESFKVWLKSWMLIFYDRSAMPQASLNKEEVEELLGDVTRRN
jgi:hypothetical protein